MIQLPATLLKLSYGKSGEKVKLSPYQIMEAYRVMRCSGPHIV
jgi:hypothetical protein